ncbi:MAG: ATP-binding protein [Bacillota bacterium]
MKWLWLTMINSLDLISYGKFKNKKINFKEGLNLIYGKNESGKSTIVSSIETLLYGIYPTKIENNNFVNWYNNKLSLKGKLLDDLEIHRYLKSNPFGQINRNRNIININNKSLDIVKNIPKEIFNDLYILNIKDLINLENETWKNVEKNIIYSYKNIISPNQYLKESDEKLKKIWRDSNRGKYELKTIEKKINKKLSEKRSLKKEYEVTKKNIDQYFNLKYSIKNRNKELEKLKNKKKEIERLLPLANLILEIDSLKKEIVKIKKFKKCNKDLVKKRIFLENKLEDVKNQIFKEKKDIKSIKNNKMKLEKEELNILEYEKNIYEKFNYIDRFLERKRELKNLKEKQNDIFDKYNKIYYKLFNEKPTKNDFKKLSDISLDNIKLKSKNKKMMLFGIGMFFLGSVFYYFNYIYISLITYSTSIGLVVNNLLNKKVKLKKYKSIIISTEFIENFKKIKELEYEIVKNDNKLINLKSEINEKNSRIKQIINDININCNLENFKNKYIEKLEIIKNKKNKNESLDIQINQIKKRIDSLKNKENKYLNSLKNLERQIKDFSENNNLKEGISNFKDNIKKQEQIDNLKEKLNNLKNKNILLNEYNNSNIKINIKNLDNIKDKISVLQESLNNDKIKLVNKKNSIENLNISDQLNQKSIELDLLREKKKKILKKKDILILKKEIVKKANNKLKNDIEPKIIKNTNKIFSRIINKDYKIFFDENSKEIYISNNSFKKSFKNFSQGTKDQLFLALRLAVIQLYEKDKKLPLILDDVFLNWDDTRLNNFIKFFKEISKKRQVLFLTCKKSNLDLIKKSFKNLNLIHLGGE